MDPRSLVPDLDSLEDRQPHLIEPRVYDPGVTRMSLDDGRNAIGRLRVRGNKREPDGIVMKFAHEAKVWSASRDLSVRATSRPFSRLRHREFGVIVTTYFISKQACQRIREDTYPTVVTDAPDIAQTLRSRGVSRAISTNVWIDRILGVG